MVVAWGAGLVFSGWHGLAAGGLLLAVVLLGCNGNKKRDDAANAKSASGVKRAPDSFEAAPEDPHLTAHTRFAAG